MKQKPQHKRHPNSQIGELAGAAVRNAQERRGRVLEAAELECATGGALGSVLLDWNIKGGMLADKLQATTGSLNVDAARGATLELSRQQIG